MITVTVTCKEMKDIEKRADEGGVSYYQMMENAGTAAFRVITRNGIPSKAAVYCGTGNNGGDGFVIARLLRDAGTEVTLSMPAGNPKTADAVTNYNLVSGLPVSENPAGDIIVDAIYGTGFHGSLSDAMTAVIETINSSDAPVYSIDIPSGLSGDMTEGDITGTAVKADYTIAFHDRKPVHTCESASPYLGEVITVSIGIEDVI